MVIRKQQLLQNRGCLIMLGINFERWFVEGGLARELWTRGPAG
ncbi:MAG: hypothetical protein QGI21_05090 [Candidatus Poseidoniaceae archaeon]|nr:hypothetical protein [Candidatus Poseidoniaceae archaeon]